MTQSGLLEPRTVDETAAYLASLSRDQLARWFADIIEQSRYALGDRRRALGR
jgi:hypothetical protein